MIEKKEKFCEFIGYKKQMNAREEKMYERAYFYIDKIKKIRGIKMIAICNSLSMNATKDDSDIDLFIVSKKKMIWYVRFWVTFYFWKWGVWRKGVDIANNFCLSFFVTENALNMQKIAIEEDIYLYFWTYFLRPILDYDETYGQFLQQNSWIFWDAEQIAKNRQFIKFSGKSQKVYWYHICINNFLKFFIKRKTLRNYEKKGRPSGVIISDDMLKFHDHDQRENIKKMFEGGKGYKKQI